MSEADSGATAEELTALAELIERSNGLVIMMDGYTAQLGIKRTAQVIAGLREAIGCRTCRAKVDCISRGEP